MVRNELKQTIRRDMLRKRAFLIPDELHLASSQITLHLQAFLQTHFVQRQRLHVAVYAAMRHELDLSSAWDMLLNWPAVLYFPAVMKTADGQDRLWFAPLPDNTKPDDWLSPRTFGVPEPPPEACLAPENLPPLDLVLVPGLAFDRLGNRIGWGKAYYDGFLATIRSQTQPPVSQSQPKGSQPQPLCVGVGYDFQLVNAELPHDRHDQTLQGILTPSGWHPVPPL